MPSASRCGSCTLAGVRLKAFLVPCWDIKSPRWVYSTLQKHFESAQCGQQPLCAPSSEQHCRHPAAAAPGMRRPCSLPHCSASGRGSTPAPGMRYHHLLSCTADCVLCRRICGLGSPLVPHTATRPWQRPAGSLTGSCGECWLVQEQHWAHACMSEISIVPLHAALCTRHPSHNTAVPCSLAGCSTAFASCKEVCTRCAASALWARFCLGNKCTTSHQRWLNCLAHSQRILPATAWLLMQAHVC